MAEFLLETYVAETDRAACAREAERCRLAADEVTREGTPVRFLRWIFVPEDETCFYLYEAASAELVREVARRAQLPFDRVAEAVADLAPTRHEEAR